MARGPMKTLKGIGAALAPKKVRERFLSFVEGRAGVGLKPPGENTQAMQAVHLKASETRLSELRAAKHVRAMRMTQAALIGVILMIILAWLLFKI